VPPEATWDNAMRLIINDPRYGALKAIGEKKATFNEYCTVRSRGLGFVRCSCSLSGAVCSCVRLPRLYRTCESRRPSLPATTRGAHVFVTCNDV
jgi:hypothetical protein